MGETDNDAADRLDENRGASDARSRPETEFQSITLEPASGLWVRIKGLPRNVIAIGLVSLLNDASSEIIYPFLPLFLAVTLGASPFAIGVIEGGAESASGLLKLFSGYLSDRLG